MISSSMPLIFVLAASLVVNCYGFTSGLTKTWSFARSLQSFDHLAVLKATSSKQRVIDIFSPQSTESTESFQLEEVLACPETLNPLTFGQRFYGFAEESFLEEPDFEKKYKRVQLPGGSGYWDMTIKSEINKPLWQQSNRERIGQSFFQNPIISGIYERGYRQQFANAGFPGIDKEYAEIEAFFSAAGVQTVLDLSCGSGFMTRRLLSSGKFKNVLCGDLSPTMLAETLRNVQTEGLSAPQAVRCDSARLPFASNSLDAVHAGAAMHCWPRLETAIQEVHRVLKPGGVFYASTFFTSAYGMPDRMPRAPQGSGFFFFLDEPEIKAFVEENGFSPVEPSAEGAGSGDVTMGGKVLVRREGRSCAIVKCVKLPLPTAVTDATDAMVAGGTEAAAAADALEMSQVDPLLRAGSPSSR